MTEPRLSDTSQPLPPPPASSLHAAQRRRPVRPVAVAALVVIGLPILEIALLIMLGRAIGVGWTVALLLGEALLGAYLLKREGGRAWTAVLDALRSGVPPTGELADGALVVMGGVLFILPGLLSDILGLLCLIPGTRSLTRKLAFRALGLKEPPAVALQRHVPSGAGQTIPGDVVEGDVVDTPYRRALGE